MELSYNYSKETEEVKAIAESLFKDLPEIVAKKNPGNKITNLTYSWNENTLSFSFKFSGIPVSGSLKVNDEEKKLTLKINLPFYLTMLAKDKDVKMFFDEIIKEYGL